jgi:hypothetical protein
VLQEFLSFLRLVKHWVLGKQRYVCSSKMLRGIFLDVCTDSFLLPKYDVTEFVLAKAVPNMKKYICATAVIP